MNCIHEFQKNKSDIMKTKGDFKNYERLYCRL